MPKERDAKVDWQADFDRLRREVDSQHLIHNRLIFVPWWMARLYGGVFLWLGWVFVGTDMLKTPFFARQFMLSQILSRSRQGGFFAGFGIFLCIATMMFIIQGKGSALLGLILGSGALMLLIWVNRPVRRFAADDDSAKDIGKRGVQAGIVWVVSKHMDTMNNETVERLRRQGWAVEARSAVKGRTASTKRQSQAQQPQQSASTERVP